MLVGEYDEMRVKFFTDPENEQIFKSMIGIAEALKLLEAILRYTELVLFEVKRDKFMRRSERNYIKWAEEQRSKLFVKNPFKVFFRFNLFYLFFPFFSFSSIFHSFNLFNFKPYNYTQLAKKFKLGENLCAAQKGLRKKK